MTLRDRLRSRQLPQAVVGIRIDWSSDSNVLHTNLEDAEHKLWLIQDGEDREAIDQAKTDVAELRAQVDALYEYVTIKAIPAGDMEALLSAHPPTDGQRANDPSAGFNRLTFFPALLAACVEGSETEESWTEMINSGELVMGELNTLIATAMELNDRSPSVSLGKDSTTTSS